MAVCNFYEVKIVDETGTIGSENKATGVLVPTPSVETFGTSSDLWSETWTPANINNANFGVVFAFQGSGGDNNYITHYLKATNFSFSIPGDATIDGIIVDLRGKLASGGGSTFDAFVDYIKITVHYTEAAGGTNMQINIGDVWKEVPAAKINIGDAWKTVAGAQINIGDAWKTIF